MRCGGAGGLAAGWLPGCIYTTADSFSLNAQLAYSYEAINNDIYLHLDPFTAENDLLTPTFKTKRNVAAKTFEKQIKTLYAARPKKAAPKL